MIIKEIKRILKWIAPYGYIIKRNEKADTKKKNEIVNFLLSLNSKEHEIHEIIDYLIRFDLSLYPYKFVRKYDYRDYNVIYDDINKSHYILHDNKKLYFPNNYTIRQIQECYNSLCIEQDKDSAHLYESENIKVMEGDVIADIGAAEGIWALQNIDKASKVFLFECDPKWITALQQTFYPWKEKVTIVNKYVSNLINKDNTTIDNYFCEQEINFIKADIEGMEISLLEGSKKTLQRDGKLKLSLCAYHRENDAEIINKILCDNGFSTEYSKGYMLWYFDKPSKKIYLTRGIVRGIKSRKMYNGL